MRGEHTQGTPPFRAITSNVLVNRAENKMVNIRSTNASTHAVMRSVSISDKRVESYAWLAAFLPSAACAAASRAMGTRYGEHDT